jgi:hypothetical protein
MSKNYDHTSKGHLKKGQVNHLDGMGKPDPHADEQHHNMNKAHGMAHGCTGACMSGEGGGDEKQHGAPSMDENTCSSR